MSNVWPYTSSIIYTNPISMVKVFYHKHYIQGKDEIDPKKHTLTEDQLDSLVGMMNSDDENDVNMAISILSRSNCNQVYDNIIWKLISEIKDGAHIWIQRTSKDKVNKRITRSMYK